MSSENQNFVTENTIYLREIANVQSSLASLLQNLHKIVEELPDNRDHKDLLKEIENIKVNIQHISSELHEHLNNINIEKQTFKKDLETLINNINHLKSFASNIEKLKYFEHFDDIKKIKANLNDINIGKNINNINKFVNMIDEISNTLNIRYQNNRVTIDDFQYIAEFARRAKKRYEWWTPRKKIFIWVVGVITSFILYFDKIIEFVKFFYK